MDNTQIKQDINNVNITIETPSDDSDIDLQALERDNWGRILNNKTFKIIKENFRLIKTSFNNFISNVTNEINTLVNKTNIIENNVNTIQTTVNELKVNGEKINEYDRDIINFAKLNQSNNFNENITLDKDLNVSGNTTIKTVKLNNDIIITYDTELKLGNQSLPLNLLSNGNIKINGNEIDFNNLNSGNITLPNNLVYNNQANDFTILPTYNSLNFATEKYVNDELNKRVEYTDLATDTEAGILTLNKVREIAPKPDLSPYQLKTNFWKYADSSFKVVGTNSGNGHSYAGVEIHMFNVAGDYVGTLHTNGGRAYYKVPNRNGGNWCEIMDNHDMAARDNRINGVESRANDAWNRTQDLYNLRNTDNNDKWQNYVKEIRLAGYIIAPVWSGNQLQERGGYVITGFVNNDGGIGVGDYGQMRAIQFYRNGSWLNTYFA